MTLLWAVPPVAMALAAVLVLLHLRRITRSAAALRAELRRLAEVHEAVDEVRASIVDAQRRARSLRR